MNTSGMHAAYGQYAALGNGYNGQQPPYISREHLQTNGYNGHYGQNYMPRGHGVRKFETIFSWSTEKINI